jgi:hypothetical protein
VVCFPKVLFLSYSRCVFTFVPIFCQLYNMHAPSGYIGILQVVPVLEGASRFLELHM